VKILLAVDGSAHAESAVRHVIRLAHACAATEVILVTVVPPSDAWELRRFMKTEEIEAMQESQGGDTLAPARALLDAAGVPCTPKVLLGPVAETLAQAAQASSAEMIVMGSRGLGAVESTLLGSTTLAVMHLSSVPVTVVK
jgi:nucleotide-binding universal stress UspA family protein